MLSISDKDVRDELARELSGMRLLHALGMRLVDTEDLTVLLHEIISAALEITAADMGNIQLVDETGVLRIRAQIGFAQPFLEFFAAVEGAESACGAALVTGERVVIQDVERSEIFAGKPSLDALREAGVRAVQSTPIVGRVGSLVGVLSTHYRQPRLPDERDLQLIDLLARQAADLIENARATRSLRETNERLLIANDQLERAFQRDHRIARDLQLAFQAPFLPKADGFAFQACYRPAASEAKLGGDFYDAFALGDGRVAFSIGDVVGHGLEAAGAMVCLRETLKAAAGLTDGDPAAILDLADEAFQRSHPDILASALFGVYDPVSQLLSTANAGHPQPALVKNGTVTLLPVGGTLVGLPFGNGSRTADERLLEPGACVVFYTDGLIEAQRNPVSGEEALLRVLKRGPVDVEHLVDTLVGEEPQHDDVAVLALSALRRVAAPSWLFKADHANSARDARRSFVSHLRHLTLSTEVIDAAAAVFGELVANVVMHAPGPIEVELYLEKSALALYVRDRGPSLSITTAALPEDALSDGGRGLFIVHTFASMPIATTRPGGGNTICVRVPFRRTKRRALASA